jgi:hypothetical protein
MTGPDVSNVQMTPEQSAQAQEWLRKQWTNSLCPFHGSTRWEVGNVFGQVMSYSPRGLFLGGPTYPVLVVTCGECGYTVLVNAIKAGVVASEQAHADRAQSGENIGEQAPEPAGAESP